MKENLEFSEKVYKQKIVSIIKKNNGLVTPADIALETSYPIIHIKYVLNKLASQYLADIQVTDNGNLLYKFNPSLKEIGKYKKILHNISMFTLSILTFIFKLLIMLTLIGYMIFYILVITAIFVAITAKGDNDNSSDFGSDFLLGLVRVVFELIINSIFFFNTDPYEKYINSSKRPFYIRVFSFVFGDDKKEKKFNHDNNIFKFIKANKWITIGQSINLTGLTEEETRKILVDMVIKYNGDIDVNDNAVIIYKFDNLEFTKNEDKKFSYSWNRLKPIPKLNYNTKKENIWIISFNIFNLIMSSLFMYFYINNGGILNSNTILSSKIFFLYLYPFIFSGLFFIIPIIRYFRLKIILPKVLLYNSFLKTLKIIFISKHGRDYIETKEINKKIQEKLYSDYPSLFIHDFIDNKEVININNYKQEIYNIKAIDN